MERHCSTCTCGGARPKVGVCIYCHRNIYAIAVGSQITSWKHTHNDEYTCGRKWLLEINKATPEENR